MIRRERLIITLARALMHAPMPAPATPREQIAPAAPIVRLVEDPLRCRCPECLQLDLLHPGEGYQLSLFPYVIQGGPSA